MNFLHRRRERVHYRRRDGIYVEEGDVWGDPNRQGKKKKQERKRHIGESDSSVSLCVIWLKNS